MPDNEQTPLTNDNFTSNDVKIKNHKTTHDGYFKIDQYTLTHKKHDGDWCQPLVREVFERGHAVAVLLYDPDIDHLVFIEQFRIGAFAALNSPWFKDKHQSPWLIECVAGIIENGESPEDVARRECIEEANCQVTDLIPISHHFASPGGTTESIFVYCGRIDASNAKGIYGLEHEGEDIRVISVPTKTAFEWLDQGRFNNAMTLIAMQWFKLNHARLKKIWF